MVALAEVAVELVQLMLELSAKQAERKACLEGPNPDPKPKAS